MTAFLFKLFFAAILFIGAKYLSKTFAQKKAIIEDPDDRRRPQLAASLLRWSGMATTALAVLMIFWAFIGTSMIWVPSGEIATFKRIYFGKSLDPGRIVALDGELGPQAKIMTAGFHFDPFITMSHSVNYEPVFTVPNGQCAIMSAKDGLPNRGGSAFAEPWSDDTKQKMVNDATYFLTEGKGQRGPQSTVLYPGSYTINPFLWETPRLIDATRVQQGTVGVIKSSVHAMVDFGAFKRPMPTTNELKVLTSNKLPKDAAGAVVVPVGAIGVWEEPLPNGQYYINTDAYRVTMVPTTTQVYEYKGGYTKREIEVIVDNDGKITQREKLDQEEQKTPETAADRAIYTKPEGWDVPQELRVLAQVNSEMAPFVVASLGLTEQNSSQVIEDRVVTPIVRSVVRDVSGGAQILFRYPKALLNDKGETILDEQGNPKTVMVSEFRPVKVLDLLNNRSSIEEAIEQQAKPEAYKEGVSILEVRLSESAIPAELLIARKREQLAQQLTKAWEQEELAQTQRQKTENALALAEQQGDLVKAEILAKAALQRKEARTTEGEGERQYLVAIAEGQKAQAEVLGEEMTAKMQMFQQGLKTFSDIAERNPEILTKGIENAHKFVSNVTVNGNGTGLEGAASIFGFLQGNSEVKSQPKKHNVPSTDRSTPLAVDVDR